MPVEYIDENGQYKIDCSAAVWSTDRIHSYYQDSARTYGELYFLCDADWVIETDTHILLVEYKNANIPGAVNPGAFKPESATKLQKVGEKFFDSLHWLYLYGKDKPRKYIYVLEYPAGNTTSRLLVRNKLRNYLPFDLQANLSSLNRKLIEDVRVVGIPEWNADDELKKYPILPVTTTSK